MHGKSTVHAFAAYLTEHENDNRQEKHIVQHRNATACDRQLAQSFAWVSPERILVYLFVPLSLSLSSITFWVPHSMTELIQLINWRNCRWQPTSRQGEINRERQGRQGGRAKQREADKLTKEISNRNHSHTQRLFDQTQHQTHCLMHTDTAVRCHTDCCIEQGLHILVLLQRLDSTTETENSKQSQNGERRVGLRNKTNNSDHHDEPIK